MDSFQEGLQPGLIQDKLFLNCPSHLQFAGGGEFVATNGLQRMELIEFCLPRSSASWGVVVATKKVEIKLVVIVYCAMPVVLEAGVVVPIIHNYRAS